MRSVTSRTARHICFTSVQRIKNIIARLIYRANSLLLICKSGGIVGQWINPTMDAVEVIRGKVSGSLFHKRCFGCVSRLVTFYFCGFRFPAIFTTQQAMIVQNPTIDLIAMAYKKFYWRQSNWRHPNIPMHWISQ